MDTKHVANLTASRLRELRKKKGLSPDSLSEAITQKYGITISTSSIKGYESGAYTAKEGASNGMGIKYLRCLADFYGVTSDYILGLNDNPASELDERAAFQYTGLSLEAVRYLHDYKDEHPKQIDILNHVLTSPELTKILMHLTNIRILSDNAEAYIHDISDDALKAKQEKNIKKLNTCQTRIYRKRQELQGEQWGYLKSTRDLADKLCNIKAIEELADTQYESVKKMSDDVLHENEVNE